MNVPALPALACCVLLLSGSASLELDRAAAERLHGQLLAKTYFVTEAARIDGVEFADKQLRLKGDIAASPSLGSAAILTRDGYFLTAKHTVDSEDPRLKPWIIDFNRGAPHAIPARRVWASTKCDLALLKAEVNAADVFEWSHREQELRNGTVLVQGGLASHMAIGTVREDVQFDRPGAEFAVVQHNVKVRHGDSGGPVVDADGRLLGINTGRLILGLDSAGIRAGGGEAIRPNIHQIERLIEMDRKASSAPPIP